MALETFEQTSSFREMCRTVTEFLFMIDTSFVTAIEQAIIQQIPQKDRLVFEQRLAWLLQIAKEQNQ